MASTSIDQQQQQQQAIKKALLNIRRACDELEKFACSTAIAPTPTSPEVSPFFATAPRVSHDCCTWCQERKPKPEVLKLRDWEVSAEQLTPEWFAARKDRVTASEMASVLSEGGMSRIELLRKKCGLSDRQMDAFGQAACDHGRKHEDGAIARFEQQTGHRVLPFGLLVDPERPSIGASPDGITYCGICIEVKCPYNRTIRPGEIPARYVSQVQCQLFVSGLQKAAFVQWGVFDDTFDITYVDPDEDWWVDNCGKIVSFYHQMLEVRQDKSKIVKYERRKKSSPSSSSGSGSPPTNRKRPPPVNTLSKGFDFILEDDDDYNIPSMR